MDSLLLSGATAGPSEKSLIDDMYRLRHAVFSERLKWTSLTPDGRERDIYDRLNPVYLICRNPVGDVIGCWRLLPTVGPYMLKDIFAHLLHGHAAPESEDCWEISRFAIDPELRDYVSLGAIGRVVGDMLIELFDFAERYGIRRIVAASDIRFDRILQRAGLETQHFGPHVRMENSSAVAGWAEISPENRARIESRLSREQVVPEILPAPATNTTIEELSNG
tara:strand:+ start:39224 stop:39889 length:666 start_codon:yes stop_codon:yes gene_type:complete